MLSFPDLSSWPAGTQGRHYRTFLRLYLWPHRATVGILALVLLAGIGLQLALPLVLRRFIDLAVGHGASEIVTTLALAYLVGALLARVVAAADDYLAEGVAWTATNALRADVALHCLRLDMAFHQEHGPGELIERIDGDAAMLANLLSRFVVAVLGNALLFAGMVVILLRIDLRVGLVLAGCAAVYLLAVTRTARLLTPRFAAARQASALLFDFVEERLRGMEDVQANGATAYLLHRLTGVLQERVRAERRAELTEATVSGVRITLATASTIAAFALAAVLYRSGALTIGTAYLIFAYTERLLEPLKGIAGQMGDLRQAAASVDRLLALLDARSPLAEGSGAPLPDGAPSITFEHVSFGYDADTMVLHDLSFQLAPGQVLGVLGRTGSGKTTLARLLVRLYDPTAGTVRLGETDLRLARVDAVRARVALVTQDVQLFHATVRENVTLFDPSISDAALLSALERLGLGAWCLGLPRGLDTVLAAGGDGLSAGQAQLLALARVFLSDPDLVILDEASARLDRATEALLDHALAGLLRGRTGVIIAHRLATLARSDDILVLEDGHIAEYGPRTLLAANPGSHYATLVRADQAEEPL